MVDWSALAADVLEYISKCLANDVDYVCFRSTCTSWRSAAPKRPLLPWLIVQPRHQPYSMVHLRNFPNRELLCPRLPEEIAKSEFLCGASRGWIALRHNAQGIFLYNPFTGVHKSLPLLIDLPPGTSMKPLSILRNLQQIVLSGDPLRDDCIIVARWAKWLIQCRLGDSSWTLISSPSVEIVFDDIAFYKGRFYGVSGGYNVFVSDLRPAAQMMKILRANPFFPDGRGENEGNNCNYLVVSSGDLLLVKMGRQRRFSVNVFRIGLDGGKLRLYKLENLNGRALFLGQQSISVPISLDSSLWCKRNCIYFMVVSSEEHESKAVTKMCGFSMEDGSTSYVSIESDGYCGIQWITPCLCY